MASTSSVSVFQRRLRAELEKREMPPGRLDRLARRAQGTVRKWLEGEAEPSLRSLEAVAEVLELQPFELLQEPPPARRARA
jgi:transcriptional regulator with XRE-family HTH domain